MNKFEDIRPYNDDEVHEALKKSIDHPIIKALLNFTFPKKNPEEVREIALSCYSIRDFQTKIIYQSVRNIIERTSGGFTYSGFDKLEPDTAYLFISNHRDIILDTSLLNVALYESNLVMTASAIGDNLVNKPFLLALSKLNRSFLIKRGQTPREMLMSSKLISEYIQDLLFDKDRSVWIAQREGRTKDGNDITQQGVLKMLALAKGKESAIQYFKKLKMVPVSISYEYDPTDVLKMPELMAKHYDQEYVKSNNEDFNTILKGATGKKRRMHISAGDILDVELDEIDSSGEPTNKQFQMLAEIIDQKIHENYKLWPSKYIAHDLLNKTNRFSDKYTEEEKRMFERRIKRRIDASNNAELENFLAMYANPVANKLKYDQNKV